MTVTMKSLTEDYERLSGTRLVEASSTFGDWEVTQDKTLNLGKLKKGNSYDVEFTVMHIPTGIHVHRVTVAGDAAEGRKVAHAVAKKLSKLSVLQGVAHGDVAAARSKTADLKMIRSAIESVPGWRGQSKV